MAVEGYDLVMIGILAVAGLLGYFRGIVWQVAWILGIVASGFVALRFGGQVAPWFGRQAPWNHLSGMLALYAATSAGVWIVFRLVSKAINAVHLSAFDHQLGLLLGLAKGALLCVVITFFTVTMAPAYRPQVVASRSGRIVADLIVRADTLLPREIHDKVDPFVRQFERDFLGPAATTGLAGGAMAGAPGGAPAGPAVSPLQAIWEGVSSAAAWASAGQAGEGAQLAGGVLPSGSAFFPAREANPLRPATFAPPPEAAPLPPRPASSAFTAAPPIGAAPPPPSFRAPGEVPPAGYAPGTQSPLRYR